VLYVNSLTGSDTVSGGGANTCAKALSPCATIGHALKEAASGATIDVADGRYPEQLVISQNVTIVGQDEAGTILDPSSLPVTMAASNQESNYPQYAVLGIEPGYDVNLENITVDASNAAANWSNISTAGCAANFVGVYYLDSKGSISDTGVTNVQLPRDLFGCQTGLAVYVATDTKKTSSVQMTGVHVTNFDKNAFTCDDLGTSCTISDSSAIGVGPTTLTAQNGLQVAFGAHAAVTGSRFADVSYTGGGGQQNAATGILLYDAAAASSISGNTVTSSDLGIYAIQDNTGPKVPNLTIAHNTVSGATDNDNPPETGYGDGIVLDSMPGAATVTDNTVSGGAEYGIALYGTAGAKVSGNTTDGNLSGIFVGGPGTFVKSGSKSNVISGNTSDRNAQIGIAVSSTSLHNLLTGNTMAGNHHLGASDLSSGNGTAHTANTWSGNICSPAGSSHPAGLCGAAPAVKVSLSLPRVGYGDETNEQITVHVAAASGNPVPTGSVSVSAGRHSLCTARLSAGTVHCELTLVQLAAGTYQLGASYTPNAGSNYFAAQSKPVSLVVTYPPQGYYRSGEAGKVLVSGPLPSLAGFATPPSDPVRGIATTPDGKGYFAVTANGVVHAAGNAVFHGDLVHPQGGHRFGPATDIVTIVATHDGAGYWLVGANGAVYGFGDAVFHGDLPKLGVHVSNIVGMTADPTGSGYLLLGSDGGTFAFGAVRFFGSIPGLGIKVDNIRGIIPAPTDTGYVLVGSDGGAFVFGQGAPFRGSLPGEHIHVNDIVGLVLTPDGQGYSMAGADGNVYVFGDAHHFPVTSGTNQALPIAAIAES
jgi:parallel beta-helix repeat protein